MLASCSPVLQTPIAVRRKTADARVPIPTTSAGAAWGGTRPSNRSRPSAGVGPCVRIVVDAPITDVDLRAVRPEDPNGDARIAALTPAVACSTFPIDAERRGRGRERLLGD